MKQAKTDLKCQHCGAVGPDVGRHIAWKGGDGFIDTIQCADLMACWRRADDRISNAEWQRLHECEIVSSDAISELEEQRS
ncbi:MAG: hypothetical protein Q8O40_08015 [Chloroflexota bacterium]|nr:hypothetical protein [Chloroflexota bacterium]